MLKFNILILLSIISSRSIKEESKLVFPFKTFSQNENRINNNSLNHKPLIINYNTSTFINENLLFFMVSPLKIGFPQKEIIAFINSFYFDLILGEISELIAKNNFDYFDIKKQYEISNMSIIEEYLYLYKNIKDIENKKYSTYTNLKFLYGNKNNNSNKNLNALIIGLTIDEKNNETNFMKQIHDKNIISSYLISFDYLNENEGMLIIGKYPHECNPEKYKENDYKSFYSYQPRTMYLTNFVMNFDEIYSYINREKFFLHKTTKANIILNSGLIVGTSEYMQFIYNNYFNEYINNNICEISSYNSNNKNYFVFFCNDNQNFTFDTFPTLNFRIKSENLTFQLEYKDLFKKIENKYYFLIVFEKYVTGFWRFGKPFLIKYTFVYNGDEKTIGFYTKKNIVGGKINNNYKEKQWKFELNIWKIIFIIFLFLSFIFLIMIISYHLGKKCNIIRKKHANELCDNYDYTSASFLFNYKNDKKNINEKNHNHKKEQHLELRDESIFNT